MDSRVEKMADVIINYSLGVQPGERVLIRSTSPAGEPLAQALYQAALRAGSEAFNYIHLRDEDSLAIEATGNLDPVNKNRILELLFRSVESHDATLLAVTHDHELLSHFDRIADFQEFQK